MSHKLKPGYHYAYRRSDKGVFCTEEYAKKHKKTTEREQVKDA